MDHEDGIRGRGKNKCFWIEEEVQTLIEVLQDMACDHSWKTDGGFKGNYMSEVHERMLIKIPPFTKQVTPHLESKIKWLKTKFHTINDMLKESGCQWNDVEKKIACERQWFESYCKNHKEAKGIWDFKFPYLNQLELVYGKDRATGVVAQGFGEAIRTTEANQKIEIGGETIGDFYHISDEEDNDVYLESQSTPTAARNTNMRNADTKQKKKKKPPTSVDNVAKKKRSVAPLDIGAQLVEINSGFRTFVDGFTANFGTIANAMAEENMREKAASERMKDVIAELMKLNLPSIDVFKVANIFSADKEKIDVFLNLPSEMRMQYVLSLLVPSPSI